jgi:hypothetical protein
MNQARNKLVTNENEGELMMSRLSDAAWWYWLATVFFLTGGFFGCTTCVYFVLALCVVQTAHFAVHRRRISAFPVQVRLAYLGLLIVGLWPPLRFVHGIQLIGTSAVVLTDYCFLARVLALLPWNRTEPFTARLVQRTMLAPPRRGEFTQECADDAPSPERMCSLRSRPISGKALTGTADPSRPAA